MSVGAGAHDGPRITHGVTNHTVGSRRAVTAYHAQSTPVILSKAKDLIKDSSVTPVSKLTEFPQNDKGRNCVTIGDLSVSEAD